MDNATEVKFYNHLKNGCEARNKLINTLTETAV